MFSFQAIRFSKNTVDIIKKEISKNINIEIKEPNKKLSFNFENEIILKNIDYKYDDNYILRILILI